jgi:outer membrane protein
VSHPAALWPALFLAAVTALRAQDSGPPRALTLAAAHAEALRDHPRLAAAQVEAEIAQESVHAARAAYFPTLNAYVDGVAAGNENTRLLAGGLNNPSIYDRLAGGLVANQLITDFGRTRNLTASAQLQARAATAGADATREQILLNVDLAYYRALEAAAVLQVAQQTLTTRQLLVDRVTALNRNQLRSELDVSFAEVAREEAQLLVQNAEGDVGKTQAALSAALGEPAPQSFQLAEPAGDVPTVPEYPALLDSALQTRPEIIGLRFDRDASQRFAQAEHDLDYPSIAAIGSVGEAPDHDAHLAPHYAAGGVQLSIPLFTGGLNASRQRAARLRSEVAVENLRAAEDEVGRDVRVAWLDFNTAVKQLQTTDQLVRHASQAFDLAQAEYKIGRSSIVELSQAQLEATSAQIAQADARYNALIQRSLVEYQIGGLR